MLIDRLIISFFSPVKYSRKWNKEAAFEFEMCRNVRSSSAARSHLPKDFARGLFCFFCHCCHPYPKTKPRRWKLWLITLHPKLVKLRHLSASLAQFEALLALGSIKKGGDFWLVNKVWKSKFCFWGKSVIDVTASARLKNSFRKLLLFLHNSPLLIFIIFELPENRTFFAQGQPQ